MMADVGAAESKAKDELRDQIAQAIAIVWTRPALRRVKSEGKHEQNRDDHQRRFKLACAGGTACVGIDWPDSRWGWTHSK